MDTKNGIESRIRKTSARILEIVQGFMSIHEDFEAVSEENDVSTNLLLLERLKMFEEGVELLKRRFNSLQESSRMVVDNKTPLAAADSVLPEQPLSENLQNASEELKGCGGPCCETENLTTPCGIRVFCGENMAVKEWVHHVDDIIKQNHWPRHYAYVPAINALRGKARKVALRLAEKTLLKVELGRGEPGKYENSSNETSVLWERKLTDEQVINRVFNLEDHAGDIDWLDLRDILTRENGWTQEYNGTFYVVGWFPGFEALVKLEKP